MANSIASTPSATHVDAPPNTPVSTVSIASPAKASFTDSNDTNTIANSKSKNGGARRKRKQAGPIDITSSSEKGKGSDKASTDPSAATVAPAKKGKTKTPVVDPTGTFYNFYAVLGREEDARAVQCS